MSRVNASTDLAAAFQRLISIPTPPANAASSSVSKGAMDTASVRSLPSRSGAGITVGDAANLAQQVKSMLVSQGASAVAAAGSQPRGEAMALLS